ncbi:MAG: FMN-binding negative transcriptional regulator [Colwellia sp.]|nr:FMN-binding negative transcriptional regulator [Colwellia sp.]
MYPPKHFQTSAEERHKLCALIADNPLATLLVNMDEPLPHISHIPFHFTECAEHTENFTETETKVLVAHVSNQHPLAKKLLTQKDVQVSLVFHGEQGYISPHCHDNAGSNGNSSGQVVPTWNYAKVHVTGFANIIQTPEQKYQQMFISSQFFEREQKQPWQLTQMSNNKVQQMLTAITFFKVSINNIEGHFKLSQNKPVQVKKSIAEKLIQSGKAELAHQIR